MRARWARRYEQAVTATDSEIGRFLDQLRLRSDWDRTIVAITGDHGEELYEHGTWHHAWNKLYREGIQVPIVIRVPGAAPVKTPQSVSHLDIAPTLLDYAGVSPASEARFALGRSLRPLIEGHESPHRPVYSEMFAHRDSPSYMLAIHDGEWKYIYDIDDPHHSKLFHLGDDPAERNNLRESCADIFRRFERMRLSHVSLGLTRLMHRRVPGEGAFKMDQILKEQMVALGYLSAD